MVDIQRDDGVYRKVSIKIWGDEKFMDLEPDEMLVYLFILTHPIMTSLGAMRHTIKGLSAELPKVNDKAFTELFRKGLVKHDRKACFIWLPNFLIYNEPANPNVVKSWARPLGQLPECELKNQLIEHVKAFIKGFSEPFRKALPKCFIKGMPIQEQEQEQEQEQKEPISDPPDQSCDSKHWEKKVGDWFDKIKDHRDVLVNDYYPNGQLNVDAFMQAKLKKNGHPGALEYCLYQLRRALEGDIQIQKPWAYLEKVFSVQNGNFNEKDGIIKHEQIKNMKVKSRAVKEILKLIGK